MHCCPAGITLSPAQVKRATELAREQGVDNAHFQVLPDSRSLPLPFFRTCGELETLCAPRGAEGGHRRIDWCSAATNPSLCFRGGRAGQVGSRCGTLLAEAERVSQKGLQSAVPEGVRTVAGAFGDR